MVNSLTIVLSEEYRHGALGGVVHESGGDEQPMPGGARRLPHAEVVLHDRAGHAPAPHRRAVAPPRLLA